VYLTTCSVVLQDSLIQAGRLNTVSTVDALAHELRELVLEGVLRPGERLGEAEWSSRYGVGRQTFRAAAQLLCQQGLAVKAPNRGFFVCRLDEHDIADLFRVRRLLELEAVRSVVASGGLPRDAEQAVRDMKGLADDAPWRAVVDADHRFHRALIEACGSSRLIGVWELVESEILLSMVARPGYGRVENAAEHEELLQLLRAGAFKAAKAAFVEHLRMSEAHVLAAHRNPSNDAVPDVGRV